MNVLFHHIAKESSGHAKEKDGKAEGPLSGAFGKTNIVGDLLAEDGPAVNGTDAAVQQQRRDGCADPFIGAPGCGFYSTEF
jgi:hypothetical protein